MINLIQLKCVLNATLLGALTAPVLAVGFQPAPGTNAVDFVRFEWHDVARNRDVPVKIYFPKAAAGPCPVILFSPGLGSSREAYGYLGEGWAALGYVAVHLQHPGSDGSIFKDGDSAHGAAAMRAVLKDPQHILDRAQDISFARNELVRLNQENSPLENRLDLSRVGLAGHSYGAAAVLIVMGESVPEVGEKYRDDRFRAAIAISPPIFHGLGFNHIYAPVLVMTGTKDAGFTHTWLRQTAYDKINSPGTCLINFKGAEHFTFGDPLQSSDTAKTDKLHPLVLAATTAFWAARLRDDPTAKAWLEQGGFSEWMKPAGKFELKP